MEGSLPLGLDMKRLTPAMIAAVAFTILFWEPMLTLGRDWWSDSDAG